MKYKGFWRFFLIVIFSYVATIWVTAAFHKSDWSFNGNYKGEAVLLLQFAFAAAFYLFCYALQADNGLLGKVGMWLMMVGTAGFCYTIYKNMDSLTKVKPFGFKEMFGNAIITGIALAVVAVEAKIVGIKKNNGNNESSPGFLREYDN